MRTVIEIISDIPANVLRGVARLDIVMPDWRTKIDKERLNLRDGQHCIAAQLQESLTGRADYFDFCDYQLGLSRIEERYEYGFTMTMGVMYSDDINTEEVLDIYYKLLTVEWKKHL